MQTVDWALSRVLELDLVRPGVAGDFLRASDERRQVIAAYLAARPAFPCAVQAELIATARHGKMLEAAYGHALTGFRKALSRSGSIIHRPLFYRYLILLLRERRTSRLIRGLERLDIERLRIIAMLPTEVRSVSAIRTHRSTQHAKDTAAVYRQFVRAGVDREALSSALANVTTPEALTAVWLRWIEKLPLPVQPLPSGENYTPITSGAMLKQTALDFRNCMRSHLVEVLDGECAFGVFERNWIVQINQREGRWFFGSVYARRNQRVCPKVRIRAKRFAARFGIRSEAKSVKEESAWAPLRRYLGRWDVDDYDLSAWG